MRTAIDWMLLALGVLLAAAGLYWMATGWDIVQVERGWASVIAGSVMLSGGLVAAAVAWAILRLRQPVGAREARAPLDLAPEAPYAPDPSFAAEPAPRRESDAGLVAPAVIGAAGLAAAAAAVAADHPREPSVEADAPDDTPAPQPIFPPLPEKATFAEPAPAVDAPRRPSVSDLLKRDEPVESARLDDPPFFAPPAIDPPREERFESESRVVFPEFGARRDEAPPVEPFEPRDLRREIEDLIAPLAAPDLEPPPPAPEPPPPPDDMLIDLDDLLGAPEPEPVADKKQDVEEPRQPEEADWLAETARSIDLELGRVEEPPKLEPQEPEPAPPAPEAAKSEPQEPAPIPAPPPSAKPAAVIGRYKSGDTDYTMYDDGSIEALTPEGAMRFASLVELRRFVEQRG